MDYSLIACYLIVGLAVIILISTLGAIGSRKLNFNYSYLGILSGILYAVFGVLISKGIDLKTAIIISCFLAIFDSTIGFLLSINFKARNGYSKEQSLKMIGIKTTLGVVLFALLFTLIGYGLNYVI